MATQSILCTPLPNGIDDVGRPRLSLLLSPRLDPQAADGTLADFPDFMDWPATLAQCEFRIRFNNSELSVAGLDTGGATRVDDRFGLPESALWQSLLPISTWIRGFAFDDRSAATVLSYSTTHLHDLTRKLYQSLAGAAGDELPAVQDLLNDNEWGKLVTDTARLDRRYIESADDMRRNVAAQFDDYINGDLPEGLEELTAFALFHTPPGQPEVQDYTDEHGNNPRPRARWRTYKRAPLPSEAELAERYDFHQIVAAMNQYPTLLRRLGIVVDFLIEPGALPQSGHALLQVELTLPEPGGAGVTREPNVAAAVHTRLTAEAFDALPRPTPAADDYRLQERLLDLSGEQFDLVQVDVDGSGLKAMNTARTLALLQSQGNLLTPTRRLPARTGVPGLRNAGLMLVHRNRGKALKNAFARAKQNNGVLVAHQQALQQNIPGPPPPPDFWAEDLVRGFRIDIWDNTTGRWQSLCRRQAKYKVKGRPPIQVDEEEGIVRLAATESPDPTSHPGLLWLHEALISWTGWSLCAPQPGRTIDPEDDVADAGAKVPAGIPLSSEYRATTGSLPRLRYGRSYWVRGRAVDLAANSLHFTTGSFGPEQPETRARPYCRFEPIRPPALALVKPAPTTVEAPAEGESMQRMAIRTFNDVPAKNTIPTAEITRRFAVPEAASAKEAEYHGMLDRQGAVDPDFFRMLVEKDSPLEEEVITSSGPLVAFHAEGDKPPAETTYAVLRPGDALPYLPDALSVEFAARIFDLPGHDQNIIIPIPVYPDGAEWPHAEPFTIVILDQPGDLPKFDPDTRELLIPLPKAARARLRLSVKPDLEALRLMGVWQWLTAAQQTNLEARALNGQHWMLTPWREIELVHAVQKPLITPDMKVRISRSPGDTFAVPHIICAVSLKSTDHVDLMAEWDEPLPDRSEGDDPDSLPPPPANRHRNDRAYGVKITPDATRYGDKPEHLVPKPDHIQAGFAGNERVARKVHEFEDTRYRRIEYWLEATTRFREYMPAEVLLEGVGDEQKLTDKNIKVIGDRAVTWIPNSAPPRAPDVLYVVPVYEWVRTAEGKTRKSWRRGGGLRVYLDRPWNSSGYGEMLAVVLPGDALNGKDPNTQPPSHPAKPYVTQWGNDPAWASPSVPGPAPTLGHFGLARTAPDPSGGWLPPFAPPTEAEQPEGPFRITDLPHPKVLGSKSPATRVNIAPHDVGWDEDRRLWYCDIEISPQGSYYPFVRLALARYQPLSVPGAHLSEVVLADFMTLAADRWLSVTGTANPLKRQVRVYGKSYSSSSGYRESKFSASEVIDLGGVGGPTTVINPIPVSAKTVVEVWVERFDPALGEDFGWKKDELAAVETAPPSPRVTLTETQRRRRAVARTRARKWAAVRRFENVLSANLVEHLVLAPALWQGSVTLPEAPDVDTRFRLVIAEYEEYLADDATPYSPTPTAKGRRLVFVEHVELT